MILPEQSFLSKPTDVIAGIMSGDACKYWTAPETLLSLAKQGMEERSYPAGPLLRRANRYWQCRPWSK